ncbi:MAG: tripartite tricarboxylate transporter TctB family protein [Hyphomicrobiaceae bacterium]|nr:tripartite tricarboxylate transporter TctB family protein [Hyphomicrobiaceae bacterium]
MVRSPQDFAAGLFVIAIAILAWMLTLPLPFDAVGGVGSGMLPKATAAILAALGAAIIAMSMFTDGERLTAWHLREMALVLGAVIVFALTIRGFALPQFGLTIPPLGLAVAGPATILIASLADRETKFGESIVFAVLLTAGCIVLFRYVLSLSIPVFPPVLGY